jgi:hypothetical protein
MKSAQYAIVARDVDLIAAAQKSSLLSIRESLPNLDGIRKVGLLVQNHVTTWLLCPFRLLHPVWKAFKFKYSSATLANISFAVDPFT